MAYISNYNKEGLDIFLLGDQPQTCPKCGIRTLFEEFHDEPEMYQIHWCRSSTCGFRFVAIDDEDFIS